MILKQEKEMPCKASQSVGRAKSLALPAQFSDDHLFKQLVLGKQQASRQGVHPTPSFLPTPHPPPRRHLHCDK